MLDRAARLRRRRRGRGVDQDRAGAAGLAARDRARAARAALPARREALGQRAGRSSALRGRGGLLAEGSVVITLAADEASPATARAAGACALARGALLPGAMMALTSGSGPAGSPILDDVIARGLRLIEAAALEAVTGDSHA